ncbi:hypothetical protein ACA910_009810 [Epithemia clementina (nom. ined.)]
MLGCWYRTGRLQLPRQQKEALLLVMIVLALSSSLVALKVSPLIYDDNNFAIEMERESTEVLKTLLQWRRTNNTNRPKQPITSEKQFDTTTTKVTMRHSSRGVVVPQQQSQPPLLERTTTTKEVDTKAARPVHNRRPVVFGAGHGSTATRTLFQALCELGIPSVHFRQDCVGAGNQIKLTPLQPTSTIMLTRRKGGGLKEGEAQRPTKTIIAMGKKKQGSPPAQIQQVRRRLLGVSYHYQEHEEDSTERRRTKRILPSSHNNNDNTTTSTNATKHTVSGLQAHHFLVKAFRKIKNCQEGMGAMNGRKTTSGRKMGQAPAIKKTTNSFTADHYDNEKSLCPIVDQAWMEQMQQWIDVVIASDDVDGLLDTPYPYFTSYILEAAERIRGMPPIVLLTERPPLEWAKRRVQDFEGQVLCRQQQRQRRQQHQNDVLLPKMAFIKTTTTNYTTNNNNISKSKIILRNGAGSNANNNTSNNNNFFGDADYQDTMDSRINNKNTKEWSPYLDVPTCLAQQQQDNHNQPLRWNDLFVQLHELLDDAAAATTTTGKGDATATTTTSRTITNGTNVDASAVYAHIANALDAHQRLVRPKARYAVNLFTRQPPLSTRDLMVELHHQIPEFGNFDWRPRKKPPRRGKNVEWPSSTNNGGNTTTHDRSEGKEVLNHNPRTSRN